VSNLVIYLDGRRAGVATQSNTGNLTFCYDESYRRSPNATPLSLAMPLAAAEHKKRVVLPYLQGLLPDSDDALRAIAQRYSVSRRSVFALLTQVGSDVAGAVEMRLEGEKSSDASHTRSNVRIVDDAELGRMLRHVVLEYAEGVAYDDQVGQFSLAGAQPKIALHRTSEGQWAVPLDATPTTHILKPVSGRMRRIDVVEQVTMDAARYLGNRVAPSRLHTIDGLDVFVTQRYDRKSVDGLWHRVHQEDLCQSLSVSPAKKYQRLEGGPGIASIAGLVKSLPFERDRRDVGRSFYQAFVFNVVAGCTDAHAKNYSVMLEGSNVSLAPLYDLITYAPYWDGETPLSSAMSVDGEYSLSKITAAQLIEAGHRFGLGDESADIVDRTRSAMVPAFEFAVENLPDHITKSSEVTEDLMRMLPQLPLVLS
jgi:serine/threonine-protein kinase HipA